MKLRVKEMARQKGIPLVQLAAKIGISNPALHQALKRENTETATLEKYAKALNCEVIELIQPEDSRFMHIYNHETGEWLGIRKVE